MNEYVLTRVDGSIYFMFKNTANFSDKRLVAVDPEGFFIIIPSWNNLAFEIMHS